ncbi:hypothetical protein QIU19_04000 [Capnocytophaga canimorsus]|nr:hypothetical protein [Capnocytophaga canimorsus]WGU69040.1 hypothetical protein QIU19_04000 [Capnocytophaga canimorsus]
MTLFEKKAEFHSEYFVKGDDFEMKFKNASSGTKNASFLELIVNYISQKYDFSEVLQNENKRRGLGGGKTGKTFNNAKNLSVFIEEPGTFFISICTKTIDKSLSERLFCRKQTRKLYYPIGFRNT